MAAVIAIGSEHLIPEFPEVTIGSRQDNVLSELRVTSQIP